MRDVVSDMKHKTLEPSSQRWAIVVGISHYQDSRLNLRFARRDAEALCDLIQLPTAGHFQRNRVLRLVDEDATTGNITRALRTFLKRPAKDDLVLIYFACHGAPDPERPTNVYLITFDTDPNDIAGTALPMREIDISLRENLLAEKVIIIADTCHSAAIGGTVGRRGSLDSSSAVNQYLQNLSKAKGGLALLTSAEANETAMEDVQWGGGHGVFTYFLLEGMRGAADYRPQNGIVTVGELFEYVRKEVMEATGYRQHPCIGTNPFDRDLPVAVTTAELRESLHLGSGQTQAHVVEATGLEVPSFRLNQSIMLPSQGAWAICFSPDGHVLATAEVDGCIRLWDTVTASLVRELHGHDAGLCTLRFAPSGRLLASAGIDRKIVLWDPRYGVMRGTLEGHSGTILSIDVHPTGRFIASAGYDGMVRIWDLVSGHCAHQWRTNRVVTHTLAYSPSGQVLATGGGDGSLTLWDAAMGEAIHQLSGHDNAILCLAFQPDGDLVTGSRDSSIKMRQQTGNVRETLRGHSHSVLCIALSAADRLIGSGGSDGSLILWDSKTGDVKQRIDAAQRAITSLSFHPAGRLLASAGCDGTVKFWAPSPHSKLTRFLSR